MALSPGNVLDQEIAFINYRLMALKLGLDYPRRGNDTSMRLFRSACPVLLRECFPFKLWASHFAWFAILVLSPRSILGGLFIFASVLACGVRCAANAFERGHRLNRFAVIELMSRRLPSACAIAVVSAVSHADSRPIPKAPQSLTIDGRTPLGVYQGAGCDGVKRLQEFERWFGRKPDLVLDFSSWKSLQSASVWAAKCWSDAGQKNVVYSLPMLPEDNSATLADGAAGRFDEVFRNYGAVLVRYGYADSIVRIGWEFNGNWYTWQAARDPQSWIAYWRRIVSAMRQVPGARFKFDWTASASGDFKAEQAYPGDDYVDIIGLDCYNELWDPKNAAAEQLWNARLNLPNGLKWQRDFALAHNKQMSYPEWGTGRRAKGFGGGDDSYFIRQMAEWIAANDVAYHSYWDYAASDYNARLSDGHQPLAAAAFLKAFAANRKSE